MCIRDSQITVLKSIRGELYDKKKEIESENTDFVVEPLLMFCSVKMASIQKVAKNASLQRTPLSHPLKICQKHEQRFHFR